MEQVTFDGRGDRVEPFSSQPCDQVKALCLRVVRFIVRNCPFQVGSVADRREYDGPRGYLRRCPKVDLNVQLWIQVKVLVVRHPSSAPRGVKAPRR